MATWAACRWGGVMLKPLPAARSCSCGSLWAPAAQEPRGQLLAWHSMRQGIVWLHASWFSTAIEAGQIRSERGVVCTAIHAARARLDSCAPGTYSSHMW